MTARIYKPARTAMQSGGAQTKNWVLEFEPQSPRRPEPLMGYTASDDTLPQVQLRFHTQEEAEAYAKRQRLDYTVQHPGKTSVQRTAYADNFRVDRKAPWSH